jgi:murein DD-endopeptidase MepM/ murein hydrolase activator NlpD/Zn-dependent protease with chaperone function
MSYLISFLFMLMISSTAIYLGAQFYAAVEPRARNWPAFWASALIMICALPVLGLIFTQLSIFNPVINLDVSAFHAPLSQMDVIATEMLSVSPAASVDMGSLLVKLISAIYFIGLLSQLVKLFAGRRKAHQIARQAVLTANSNGLDFWQTDTCVSPFAITPFGRLAKSRIIISSHFIEALSAEELQAVLAHERAHISRRDDETGMVLRSILALFWFNPIAHIFFDRWKQSAEIQCDAAVTRTRSPEMRRAYAETLIKALHITAERVRQYPTASFSNPRLRNAKMRIKSIMSGPAPIFKRSSHKFALLTSMAFMTLGGAALMSTTALADPVEKAPNLTKAKHVNDISFMLTGRLTSPFGQMRDIFKEGKKTDHHGIDVAAPTGTPIYAPADGVIIEATDIYNGMPAYGTVVMIQTSDDLVTFLSHLDSYVVEKGERVTKGQKIALVGNSGKSTAPHVHIETRLNGKRVDPMTVWPFKN